MTRVSNEGGEWPQTLSQSFAKPVSVRPVSSAYDTVTLPPVTPPPLPSILSSSHSPNFCIAGPLGERRYVRNGVLPYGVYFLCHCYTYTVHSMPTVSHEKLVVHHWSTLRGIIHPIMQCAWAWMWWMWSATNKDSEWCYKPAWSIQTRQILSEHAHSKNSNLTVLFHKLLKCGKNVKLMKQKAHLVCMTKLFVCCTFTVLYIFYRYFYSNLKPVIYSTFNIFRPSDWK